MKSSTKPILKILNVITWVAFIGACIKTGTVAVTFIISLYVNPEGAENVHTGLNLSDLYSFSVWHYSAIVISIILMTALKALMLYYVIQIFLKINLVHPFSAEISKLIMKISEIALGIGISSIFVEGYIKWLIKRGVSFSGLNDYIGGAGEFILLGGIIFVIAQVFNRGIELQSENELTI